MATIQTPCPECGSESQLEPDHVALLPGDRSTHAHYAFMCTRCEAPIVKRADKHVVALLRTARVSVSGGTERVCAPHPEAPRAGAAFTFDDLIDFHRALANDGWFTRLATGER